MDNSFRLEYESNLLAHRVAPTLATVLGTGVVSYCLGQRVYTFGIFSHGGLSSMTVSRFWLFFLLIDSLFFLVGCQYFSVLASFGIPVHVTSFNCSASPSTSYPRVPLIVYSVVEKVYAVWPNRGSRLTSTAYKVGLVALVGFLSLLVVFIIGRETHIRDDGECVIGSRNSVTLAILLVDVGVNVLLTSLFLVPLMRGTKFSPQVRQVAVRNFIASTICFFSSVANLAALAALHGHEVAWICVSSCCADITINAVLAFWVTRPPTQFECSSGDVSASIRWMRTREMDADEVILSRFDRKEGLHIDLKPSNDRSVSTRDPGVEPDSDSMNHTYYSGTKSLPPSALDLPSYPKHGSVTHA